LLDKNLALPALFCGMQRADASLQKFENANTLWSILDTAIDGIILIDEKGVIQLVNQAVEKMFGYVYQELNGQNISKLMHSPNQENHDAYLQRYRNTGEKRIIGVGREVTAQKKNGEVFPLRLAVSEVSIEGVRYFTGILHDLTDQKVAEDQLYKLTQELELKVQQRTEELGEAVNKLLRVNQQYKQEISERIDIQNELIEKEAELKSLLNKEIELNQMKSRFVSMASHEFRTPLSTILSSAALIGRYTDTTDQEKREKHIGKIKNAVSNLTNILNDFLSLEKLEEGSLAPRLETVKIHSFCHDLVEEINLILKEGQHLRLQVDEQIDTLQSDPRFLYNALVNILSNAIKYSPEKSEIVFRVACKGDKVVFSVQDQGMGIPEDEQPMLFNRFFRARNAVNIQGTGLGLHIVKRYLDLLSGEISFESKPGKGTRFDIFIPDPCGVNQDIV
jgi:two-component system, LuxR family, sensor kinase FixL